MFQTPERLGRPVDEQTRSSFKHFTQSKNESNLKDVINDLDSVDFISFKRPTLLMRKLCCMCLKTTKQ